MDFVNKELNIDDTNWIRFNPDEHDFDIAKVIGAVYRKIDEIKDKTRKSTDERQCFRCNVDKKLEFFKKSSTGFTKTCIDCLDKDKNNRTKKFKPVRQYTLGGVFIKQFESVKEAADALNISSGQISANCRNPTKIKTAGKYMWKFANEQKEKNIDGMKSDVIKTVAQYNTDGEFIKTFSSGHEAASEYDVTPSSIYGAIRNNFVSKGFLWRYVEDGIIIPKIDKVTPHRKYMKQVDIYKDDVLFKSFLSIREAANEMKINITMCRKFLEGAKSDPVGYKWKFKVI